MSMTTVIKANLKRTRLWNYDCIISTADGHMQFDDGYKPEPEMQSESVLIFWSPWAGIGARVARVEEKRCTYINDTTTITNKPLLSYLHDHRQ